MSWNLSTIPGLGLHIKRTYINSIFYLFHPRFRDKLATVQLVLIGNYERYLHKV